jgi:hypothetical protein
VLLEDMAAPHALRIHARVRPATKGAPQSGLLAVGPSLGPLLFQVFFPGGAPTTRRFKGGRVRYRVEVFTILVNVIFWVEEPVDVFSQCCISDPLRIRLLVGEGGEGVVEKHGVRV